MKSRKRLIVNADGFGFGPGATQGVVEAIERGGFITSLSVNANFPEAERIRELVEKHPTISVGVHLNPVVGRPCLPPAEVSTLVNSDGFFHGAKFRARWRQGRISAGELRAELTAQITRIREMAGAALTHLDSHQNLHLDYFGLFLEVARQTRVPCMRTNASLIGLELNHPWKRWGTYLRRPHVWLGHRYRRRQMRRARRSGMRMADALVTVGHVGAGNKSVMENWLRILANLPAGTYEIYCHPAYPDETLRRWATYVDDRLKELAILSDPRLVAAAEQAGVELISFHQL
jgi:chitin disaccharide deacetylase